MPKPINRSDIPIEEAIYDLRRKILENGGDPSSEEWTSRCKTTTDNSNTPSRENTLNFVANHPAVKNAGINVSQIEIINRIMNIFLKHRKATKLPIGMSKRELLVYVGRRDHWLCVHQGKENCDDYIQLERMQPGANGGTYTKENCKIVCGKHNASRGKKPMEQFYSSPLFEGNDLFEEKKGEDPSIFELH